ncbi:MAG: AAA family ATPase [Bacillota bacterium]
MGFTIALAGKGGSGKTTVAALTIRHLIRQGRAPILAVDADPNANLAETLGMAAAGDLAGILAEMGGGTGRFASLSTDKLAYIEARVHDVLTEGQDVDLLAMGCPDGQGCYCFANAVLREQYTRLARNYRYVVIDNEAGLEHLSRRTTGRADLLVVVSDASIRGVRAAGRIAGLAARLKLEITRTCLLVTKVRGRLAPELRSAIEATGLEFAGVLPYDPLVYTYDGSGRPLVALPDETPAVRWFTPVAEGWLEDLEKREGKEPHKACPLHRIVSNGGTGSLK